MMDPETETRVKAELEQLIGGFLMHKMREYAGEYPGKLRVSVFFNRGGTKSHMIEVEGRYDHATLEQAEADYLKYEKERLVKEAASFMTGKP